MSPGDSCTVTNGYINERVNVTKNFLTFQSANTLGATNMGFFGPGASNTINGFTIHCTNTFSTFDEADCTGVALTSDGNTICSNFVYDSGLGAVYIPGKWNSVFGNTGDTNGWMCVLENKATSISNHVFGNFVFRTVQFSQYCTNRTLVASLDADGFYPAAGSGSVWESNYVGQINFLDPNSPTAHCDGFQILPGQVHNYGLTLNANFVEGTNANGAAFFAEGTSNVTLINNGCKAHKGLSADSGNTQWLVANNTLMMVTNDFMASNSIAIALKTCTNFALVNNIILDPQQNGVIIFDTCSGMTHSNNMEFSTAWTLNADPSYSTNGDFWNVNPQLVNPYSFPPNFTPVTTSPVFGNGTVLPAVTKDFFSFPRSGRNDIGAVQIELNNIAKITTLRVVNAYLGP